MLRNVGLVIAAGSITLGVFLLSIPAGFVVAGLLVGALILLSE